jgi:hypothetical protein
MGHTKCDRWETVTDGDLKTAQFGKDCLMNRCNWSFQWLPLGIQQFPFISLIFDIFFKENGPGLHRSEEATQPFISLQVPIILSKPLSHAQPRFLKGGSATN